MGQPPKLAGPALACLLLLFVGAESSSKCQVGCHGMHPSKLYQEGHTYVYDLEGLSVTSATNAKDDTSLRLSAIAELSVKPDCVHQLRLKNVQFNKKHVNLPDVEKYAVQFNYHDGHIDTEMCTEPGDSQASLNIKRAVVSMFQSAVMQDSGATTHHETDVFGVCPTDFSFRKEGDSLIINKHRNLAQCAFRESINHDLISASVDTSAGVKAAPFLASDQDIEQRFKRGILNKAVSKETYLLRPANDHSVAKTVVRTTLTLKGDKADNPTAPVSQPKSLIFEAPHPVLKSTAADITNALKAATAEVSSGVKPKAAEKFSDLVKVLRLSSKNDILSVYQKVRAKAGFDKDDQKLLLDALFRAGSGESAEVAAELIKNKEISGIQATLFYASLALVRHVNLPSVAAVTSLLDQPNLPRLGYLGVGQVIGKYCQDHSCENVAEVKEAVRKIREKVGNGKAKTKELENLVVSALKALGNTQFLDDPTLQKVANIAADKNVKNRVRVAAIEALPARCSMKWKNILFKVLGDREEDSEIRIKTYLSLVACPCPHVANNLKEILDKETVNQVGSFIQTHLRNLRASTDPNKLNAKNQLGLIKPKSKFPEDFRKFSFNEELSYKIDAFGLGSSVESNVIYSQNSFVPRSTCLNLTMELFGRSFNFLELDTRVENLDRLLEHYFGPKGQFWEDDENTSAAGIIKSSKKKLLSISRPKREVKQGDLDRFAKNVHLRDNELNEDLDIDLSVKLFGVELAYLSYQGDTNKINPEYINRLINENVGKGLDLLKVLNYDLQNYLQFLDAELVYPTSLGCPLTLGLTGTSAVQLKTHGKLDIQAILAKPKNAEVKIAIEPSVSLTLAARMTIDGLEAMSGIKMLTTLHSATGADLSLSMLDGKGVDVNLEMLKKRQELISVKSDVLISSGDKGQEYVECKFETRKPYFDCFDQLQTILGVQVCGKLSLPHTSLAAIWKPLFPPSEPASFAVYVDNNDVTNYHFKLYMNTDDPKKRSFELFFDTPKSKSNRHISLTLDAGLEPNMYIKGALNTPIKKLSFETVMKNTPEERSLTATVLNDQIKYYGKMGVLISGNKYKPVLEYSDNEQNEHPAKKTGVRAGQQYTVQGSVDVADYQGGQKYVLDKVTLMAGGHKLVAIDGNIVWTPSSMLLDTNLGYDEKTLALKLDGKKLAENNYVLTVSALPSTDPNIAFNLKWAFKRGPQELENLIVFIHGPDQNSEVNRFTLTQSAVYKLASENFLLSTANELTYPAMDTKLKLDGKVTPKSISGDVEVKYKKFKVGGELSAQKDMQQPGDYEVELEAELMENSVKVKSRRAVIDAHKNKYSNSLILTPGGKYDAEATVIYDTTRNNINLQLDGDLNLNGKKVKVDTRLEVNPQSINSKAFIKVNAVKYVDFLLKTQKSPHPTGNLNLNLKNYLTANGQYTYQHGKGSGNLNINLPKINRMIKISEDIAVSGSQHVANLEILYDADNDPNKIIKLSTNSDITKNSIDSKNVVQFMNHKIELNGKGKRQGTFNEGQIQADIDLTLPDGRYIVYKLNRNSAKKGTKYDVQVNSELMDQVKKGGDTRKLTYVAEAKDFDVQAATYNMNGELTFVNVDGKDLKLSWGGLRLVKEDQNKELEANAALSGAYFPKVHAQFSTKKHDKEHSYKVKGSMGDNLSVTSVGSYNTENNKQEFLLHLILPNEKLSNLKLQTSSSFQTPTDESELFESLENLVLTYNNDKTIKMESYLKLQGPLNLENDNDGAGRLILNVLNLPPMALKGNYKYSITDKKKAASVTLSAKYGDKEATFQSNNKYLPQLATVNADLKCALPLEKVRNIDMKVVYKHMKDIHKRDTNVVLLIDDVKYTLDSEIQMQEANSIFHMVTTCPSGKNEVLSNLKKLGDKEYKAEWQVTTPQGFVAVDTHANLESIDNFIITANFDSDKIKQRKIHAEIANKPAKAGKRIVITVTSDGQNIVTGSTNYKKRDEDGKVVVEGNGSLKVGENVRSSSFKYTRQQLTKEKDGEIGTAMVLNANFGPSAIVGEFKLSNKELHVFNSYCEQSKDCAQFKLQSILDIEHKSIRKHQITVDVHLKKFNIPAEFGLKTNTEYRSPIFDHTTNLYLHSTKDKTEYTYQLYIHPKESAAVLTLPARELALVLTYDLPKTKQTGAYKLDLSLFLDRKNKPSDKTSLSATGDINIDKNSLSLNGETKFTYPTQSKDMIVKGRMHCGGEHLLDANLDVDIFAKKSQKISILANVQRQQLPTGYNMTSSVEVNSRGQQLKLDLKSHLTLTTDQAGFGSFFTYNDKDQKPKTLGTLFSADMKHVYLLVTLPDKELIKEEWKMELSKNLLKINGELSLLGNKPTVTNFEANDLNRFKLVTYSKENPNTKLAVNGEIVLGQLAGLNVDAFKEGTKKSLFHILVHLDEKQFLKPDFDYNKENTVETIDYINNKYLQLGQSLKGIQDYVLQEVKEEGTDFAEHLKKAQLNMKPLLDYYQGELNKMKDEINADETVKEIQAILNKYFGAIATAVTETMKQVAERLAELQKQSNEIVANLSEAMKSVYPQLKASQEKILKSVIEILEAAQKLASTWLKAALNIINEHQKELKDILGLVSEATQDFAKIITKGLAQLKQDLEEFGALLINQLKALPVYEIIKEKYANLKYFQLPEPIVSSVQEICNALKASMPTQELRQLLDAICQYLVKHMTNEKLDEVPEIKKIYSLTVTAIRSIVTLLQKQATLDNVLSGIQLHAPIDVNLLSKLPGISTLRLSLFNLLRNRELPSPLDLYYTYMPTLYSKDIIGPFTMSGYVTDGGHYFTFDGHHLTMPGTCSYILAQDMQDGNFSVIANFNDGVLISVTVTEPKESITLKNNGNILTNNKPAEFPTSTKNLHAFLVHPFANIVSDYGVKVICSSNPPMHCAVQVSGFYLGKLRGLLGDGNNEPYDDFTLPSGKITESATEFGNAYKLKSDCPAANAVEHKDRAPVCTQYFAGYSSPLNSCFKYVNPAQYRDACDHAVAAGHSEGACLIASAYHHACYVRGLKSTHVPSSCSNCKVGATTVPIGETFSVKTPKAEADIIFVVEQQSSNEKVFKELVTPLMSELREELAHQGITHVHIGLIGFSENTKWPQHYTVNGETNIKGEVKNMKFSESEPTIELQEAKEGNIEKQITYVGQRLDVELGTLRLTDAYEEAIKYPFRAGAAKTVVGVLASPCEMSPLPFSLQQLRLLLGQKIYRDQGLTYHQMSFPKELLVSGKPQKNVVGYDKDSVYTLADSRKKPLVGSSEMKSHLTTGVNDVCADFAVASGGAVFNSDNFLKAKSNQKKEFIQVAARRIADSLTNVELEKDCSCELQYGLIGRAQCTTVGRKRKETPTKFTKGGVKG